ncbi:thiol-disulfide oxidoreductase DCC family protein [Autumnicola musiva]|uniref:Thiol-disulfide oxidoreductase DCC family protein n=1 Tax=Autumnicola musiva TaxID=3075589 RepID=A0ABU3D749_9FLAO|nr:thiol-disulfide oxidoreductase DCC family protein [Zunongwangia sp. F117]MDT0677369.1 thiol-disulfide oxidoreductase DCC family protein [Zunongwangia sp. F117]
MKNIPKDKKIVLFDGVCNLCDGAVTFIIKHDKKDIFRFASLQSEIGKHLMAERGMDPEIIDSVVLVDPGVAWYRKSTAALEISRDLKGGYSLLKHLLALPEGFRDLAYDLVAKNRYEWFGKKESCMIPTPELKSKFLD